MNMQTWGLTWFNQYRNLHCVEPITITSSDSSLGMNASVIEPDSLVNSETKLRTHVNLYLFVVNTIDLKGMKLQTGVRIKRGEKNYEVVINKTVRDYMNDPNDNETVIPAKILTYAPI